MGHLGGSRGDLESGLKVIEGVLAAMLNKWPQEGPGKWYILKRIVKNTISGALGGCLGRILEALWGVLEACGAVLKALGGVLEALESVLEALDVVLEAMMGQGSSKQARETENIEIQ